MPETTGDLLVQLVQLTQRLRDELLSQVAGVSPDPNWLALFQQFETQTGVNDSPHRFADSVAQAATCSMFMMRLAVPNSLPHRGVDWLIAQADPLPREVLRLCLLATGTSRRGGLACASDISQFLQLDRVHALEKLLSSDHGHDNRCVYFYEQFLQAYDGRARRQHGVFYTPKNVVSFIVRSVDKLLRSEFQLTDGLSDNSSWHDLSNQVDRHLTSRKERGPLPFVRILDPAMGTGAFLLEVLELVHGQFMDRVSQTISDKTSVAVAWNEFVENRLLARLHGYELMLPPLVLAQIQMAVSLAKTGYEFHRPTKLNFRLTNTLQEPDSENDPRDKPFTIVVGNPPFSGISKNQSRWIRGLLRGKPHHAGQTIANYFTVDGQPLAERKHWMQDDYVKFIRFCHWLTELAGAGIVALVTNHGFLDNSTFRGMREQLIDTFPQITLVDLHGNKRCGETPPDGGIDQGVFPIEQGVAISLLRRPIIQPDQAQVLYAEMWGPRREKLATLGEVSVESLEAIELSPQSPYYFLVPKDICRQAEYDRGHRLSDIMPLNSTAAVTARDGFVVAFDEGQLHDRIATFRDLSVPDDAVQSQFFTNTRSSKHAPGNTRSWQLPKARRRMHDEPQWERHIQSCFYRPFDRRSIFWTPWMIDWPRDNVMQHLLDGTNLALVARRQTPPSQPCNFFWVTDSIVIDGLIRSDNRGSESVFPLYVLDCDERPLFAQTRSEETKPHHQANFSAEFIRYCERCLNLKWVPEKTTHKSNCFGPRQLFWYLYALFHAPCYRNRFQAWLRVDFPRVFLPKQSELFRRMSDIGKQLIAEHLLKSTNPPVVTPNDAGEPIAVGRGYPQYRENKIWLNDSFSLGPITNETWLFRVGSHQVCHKWLRDRRGCQLNTCDVRQFCQVISAIANTQQLMLEIDRQISLCGGWETAFRNEGIEGQP